MVWKNKKEDGRVEGTDTYIFEGRPYEIETQLDGDTGIYYLIPSKDRKTWCAEFYTLKKLKRLALQKKKEEAEKKK